MTESNVIDLRSSPDFRCLICHREGTWSLMRCRDGRRVWSCDDHLARVMTSIQHERGMTKLTVWPSGKCAAEAASQVL